MAEQDRGLWNAGYITEGVALITEALPRGATGPYQIRAAIAAIHDEAPSAEATDWPQITALYELVMQTSDNPVVALDHVVAVAMVRGTRAGLDLLDGLGTDERIAGSHRVHGGPRAPAGDGRRAGGGPPVVPGGGATDHQLPQQRYLHARAGRLTVDG